VAGDVLRPSSQQPASERTLSHSLSRSVLRYNPNLLAMKVLPVDLPARPCGRDHYIEESNNQPGGAAVHRPRASVCAFNGGGVVAREEVGLTADSAIAPVA